MKKNKNKDKNKIPIIIIDTIQNQSWQTLWLQAIVRIFMLCLVTAGTCLITAQIYKIPVNELWVALVSFGWALIFNITFIVLKFRYAFPLIFLACIFSIYFNLERFLFNVGCFTDFFLLRLDSRVLYTSQFAGRTRDALENMPQEFLTGIRESLFIFCAVIALIYALAGRGRFVGSVLITVTVIMIPAFGAELATLSSGMLPLLLGMYGLYAIWSSQEHVDTAKPVKRKGVKKSGRITGGLPRVRRHGINGLIAVFAALLSYNTAEYLLPQEKTDDLFGFIQNTNEKMVDFWLEFIEVFESGFSSGIENNGYFPSNFISSSLTLDAPTASRKPVMNVTREDIDNPLFLKVDIGVVLDDDKFVWDKGGNNPKIEQLNELIEDFYPEHEYLLTRQKLSSMRYDPDTYIGIQQVSVEYLVRTKHEVLPTFPYLPKFKEYYDWSLDTAIKGRQNTTVNETRIWDVLYPKTNVYAMDMVFGSVSNAYNFVSYAENPINGSNDYLRAYFSLNALMGIIIDTCASEYGLTALEYLNYAEQYKELVHEIYTVGSEKESANISRLKKEMQESGYIDYKSSELLSTQAFFVRRITDYFRNNYEYSLTADNKSGENTVLGNFLFDTRKGHCALYATAMTLLLRAEGIPARYVTGYAVNGGVKNADGNYVYTVLERDLHAWVEVYFSDVGWIPYDPTPSISESVFEEIYGGTEQTERTTTPATTTVTTVTTTVTTAPVTESSPETSPSASDSRSEITTKSDEEPFTLPPYAIPAVIIAFSVLFVILFAVLFAKALKRAEKKRTARYGSVKTRKTAEEIYTFIIRLLKMEGFSAGIGELPSEFALRVSDTFEQEPETESEFVDVMVILEKLEFSGEELTEREYKLLGDFAIWLYQKIIAEKKPFTRILRKIVINNIL